MIFAFREESIASATNVLGHPPAEVGLLSALPVLHRWNFICSRRCRGSPLRERPRRTEQDDEQHPLPETPWSKGANVRRSLKSESLAKCEVNRNSKWKGATPGVCAMCRRVPGPSGEARCSAPSYTDACLRWSTRGMNKLWLERASATWDRGPNLFNPDSEGTLWMASICRGSVVHVLICKSMKRRFDNLELHGARAGDD